MRALIVCLVGIVWFCAPPSFSQGAGGQKNGHFRPESQSGRVISGLNQAGVHNSLSDISRDGKTLFITYSAPDFSSTTLVSSQLIGGKWSPPLPVLFSDQKSDLSASLNPAQDRMFFTSQRPIPGKKNSDPWNLWVAQRKVNGWNAPNPVDEPVNSGQLECCVSAKAAGKLYFSSNRDGSWDIYCAELKGDSVGKVVKLAGDLNKYLTENFQTF
ncbi:MAG: PD40 domain-containing protein [Acidobacteria bacterium]|nr:PD40 domain-containing protein [Acidobacteriota bacterium]